MLKLVARISVFTMSVFILTSIGALAQSTIPPVVVHTTGMAGLAEGQTARFNVLNPGVLPPALGVICNATLTFFSAEGKVLKNAAVTVNPGQAQFIDLFGDADLGLTIDERKQIRATITQPGILPPTPTPVASAAGAPPLPASCTLIGTLEILDTVTGRSQVVLGAGHAVPSGPVTAASN